MGAEERAIKMNDTIPEQIEMNYKRIETKLDLLRQNSFNYLAKAIIN